MAKVRMLWKRTAANLRWTPHTFFLFFFFSRLRSAALKMVLVLSFCFQGRQDDNSQKFESCPLAALHRWWWPRMGVDKSTTTALMGVFFFFGDIQFLVICAAPEMTFLCSVSAPQEKSKNTLEESALTQIYVFLLGISENQSYVSNIFTAIKLAYFAAVLSSRLSGCGCNAPLVTIILSGDATQLEASK